MLKNYLKTTWRALMKSKGFTMLNIFGLAIGIACTAFIFLWVENEVNYDSQHVNKDKLYLVRENQKYDSRVFTHSSTPGLLGPAIQAEIPGIANTCRASEGKTTLLFTNGDHSVFASGRYAEPSFFTMFTLPFVQGSAANAFTQLHTIVITQKTAKKFFGDQDNVIGKTIRVDASQDYVVSGVIQDLPINSTLQFEWVMPFKLYFDKNPGLQSWGNNSINTYVQLAPGADVENVNKQLYSYIQKHQAGSLTRLFMFSMNDWHLYDRFENGKKTGGGQIEYVHLFTVIAWIVLFIACINFMNLATARSEKRAREVGVRKVLGAGKKMLVIQFIGEALLTAIIAAVIALLIVMLGLPGFNTLVQNQLSLGLTNPSHIPGLLLIAIVCGLVAGSYPSLYLSSFNPVGVLKGLKLKDSGAEYVRKGLVVMQFSASVVLIISTVVVYQQIQHVKSRQLGFDKNNLVEYKVHGEMGKNFNAIKQELISTGNVENVALSDHVTIDGGNNTSGFTWAGKPATSQVLISNRYVTPEFIQTSGMQILEGRNIDYADSAAQTTVLVTKSLEALMGPGSAVGKILRREGDTNQATIVGVVNDYQYGSMYNNPDPVVFHGLPYAYAKVMYVRIKPGKDIEPTLAGIQQIMKKNNPAYPVDYHFVDEQFNNLFLNEMLVSKLSRLFSALAIIISCLGLFGLAAYSAERRTKEIGIRKVLGASVFGITGLLYKNFLQLIGISCLLAFPMAYWAISSWLKNYAYCVDIHWWVFIAAGAVAVVIAFVTISFQSIKAALANPVKSLRSE